MFDLKAFLKDKKIRQNDFADIIGKSQSSISYVVGGKMDLPEDWTKLIKDKFPDVDLSLYEIEEDISIAMEPESPFGYGISIPGLMKVISEQAEAIRELTATQARLVDLLSKKY
jgi:predicted XRE-type DNA-binding protein